MGGIYFVNFSIENILKLFIRNLGRTDIKACMLFSRSGSIFCPLFTCFPPIIVFQSYNDKVRLYSKWGGVLLCRDVFKFCKQQEEKTQIIHELYILVLSSFTDNLAWEWQFSSKDMFRSVERLNRKSDYICNKMSPEKNKM